MSGERDFNLAVFLRDVWRAREFVLVGLGCGIVLAFGFVVLAVSQYEARILIAPAQGFEAIVSNAQHMGGDATGGVSRAVVQPVYSRFTHFQAVYSGAAVAEILLRDPKIVEGLRADQRFVFDGARAASSAVDLADYIAQRVWFDPFGESVLRAMHYRHQDAKFAAYFLQQIHRVTDQLIRVDLRNGVDERIAYLERLIGKIYNPDHKRAMTGLLLEQERLRMVASMDEPVAAKVVEKVRVGSKAVWPDPYLLYGGLGILGAFLGYIVFGVVSYEQAMRLRREVSMVRNVQARKEAAVRKKGLDYSGWFKKENDNLNIPDDAVNQQDGRMDERKNRDGAE